MPASAEATSGFEAVPVVADGSVGGASDDDEELVDDDDDYDQETSPTEGVDAESVSSSASSVLQAVGLGRVFRVSTILRALMGHRPSILLAGRLEEIVQRPDGSVVLEGVAIQKTEQANKQGESDHNAADSLQISLRYEPPSAKFKASRGVSFRLSVIEAGHSLLSCRGLPTVLSIQTGALAVAWGPLQIVFDNGDQMDAFFAIVSKYVEIRPATLWPPHVIALWVRTRSTMPDDSCFSEATGGVLASRQQDTASGADVCSQAEQEVESQAGALREAPPAAVAAETQTGASVYATQPVHSQQPAQDNSSWGSPISAITSLPGFLSRYPVATFAVAACSIVAVAVIVAQSRRSS